MSFRAASLAGLALLLGVLPTWFGLDYLFYDLQEGTVIAEDLPFMLVAISLGYLMILLGLQRGTKGILERSWAWTSGVVACASLLVSLFSILVLAPSYDLGPAESDFWFFVVGPVAATLLFTFLSVEARWFS